MRVKDMKRCSFPIPDNIMENSLFYAFKNTKIFQNSNENKKVKKI